MLGTGPSAKGNPVRAVAGAHVGLGFEGDENLVDVDAVDARGASRGFELRGEGESVAGGPAKAHERGVNGSGGGGVR